MCDKVVPSAEEDIKYRNVCLCHLSTVSKEGIFINVVFNFHFMKQLMSNWNISSSQATLGKHMFFVYNK